MKLAAKQNDDLSRDERDLLLTPEYTLIALSKTLGMLYTPMLRQMSSRDYTRYQAAALIEQAQQRIVAAQMERRRKQHAHARSRR